VRRNARITTCRPAFEAYKGLAVPRRACPHACLALSAGRRRLFLQSEHHFDAKKGDVCGCPLVHIPSYLCYSLLRVTQQRCPNGNKK